MSRSEKNNTAGRYLLNGTCRYFTLFCIILLVVVAFGIFGGSVRPVRFLLLLPFAATVASANAIYRFAPLSAGARHFLHFLLCILGFYLFVCLPVQILSNGSVFVTFVLSCAAYGLGLAAFLVVRRLRNRKQIEQKPYESQFFKSK